MTTPIDLIATLGVIALIGMIIRSSVILIDQIEAYIAPAWFHVREPRTRARGS